MSEDDPMRLTSLELAIGKATRLVGMLTEAEAATLAGLREGRLVAVPREPTEAMLRAATDSGGGYRGKWAAMLAAAQKDTTDG